MDIMFGTELHATNEELFMRLYRIPRYSNVQRGVLRRFLVNGEVCGQKLRFFISRKAAIVSSPSSSHQRLAPHPSASTTTLLLSRTSLAIIPGELHFHCLKPPSRWLRHEP